MKHVPPTALRTPVQEEKTEQAPDYWEGMLNKAALNAMRRCARAAMTFVDATPGEALELFAKANDKLDLASESSIRRVLAKNPRLIFVARKPERREAAALLALLPLNEFGASMLISGQLDGKNPDPAWISKPGETPAALYIWLFYGPGLYFRCLKSLGEVLQSYGRGVAIFTRGATALSEGLALRTGYTRAKQVFAGAPEWLLVALPQKEVMPRRSAKAPQRVDIRQARSFEDLAQIISIRSATYLAEQFPTYAEEFDGNDFCATHLLGSIGGDPAGAVRIRYFGDFAKVERLAVKLEYRRSKLAFRLVRAAIEHARRKGFTRLYGHASEEIAPFWKVFGAKEVPDRPAFKFANVEYREMYCDFEPDPLAITFGAHPMITIRPEGLWDEPGSLDWSNLNADPIRKELMDVFSRVQRV